MDKSMPNTPGPTPAPNVSAGKQINSEEVAQSILNTITEYSPYICILLAILLIISLITHITSDSSDSSDSSESGPTYSGNKSLDGLWTSAKGNDISSDARMTSQVSLSSNEYSCKFDVTYEGDDYRDVACISGCSLGVEGDDDTPNEKFCNQYRFSARETERDKQGTMLSRFLDSEYLSDHPEFIDTPEAGENPGE
jgi:hypothetical protein